MIAVFSHQRAVEVDRVIKQLNIEGHVPVRVNTGHNEAEASVELGPSGAVVDARAWCDGRELCMSEVRAAWLHQMPPARPASLREGPTGVAAESSRIRMWEALFDTLADDKWISPPKALAQVANKVSQYRMAGAAGLAIPPTLAGNSPNPVRTHTKDPAVIKYLGDSSQLWGLGRDGFAAVTTSAFEDLEDDEIVAAPAIFQRAIETTREVRVVAVRGKDHSEVFAAGGTKPAGVLDIRLDNEALGGFEPLKLPIEVQVQLLDAMGLMDVGFCSADLLVDSDGTHWFIDLNATGAWWWIDDLYDGEITRALAGRLLAGAAE